MYEFEFVFKIIILAMPPMCLARIEKAGSVVRNACTMYIRRYVHTDFRVSSLKCTEHKFKNFLG